MILSQSNTLTQDIDAARKLGFTNDFYFRDGKINCRGTNNTYDHDACFLVEYCRHEGMTDPGDASILFLVQCTDGQKGHLSSAYGIYADTDLIEFMLSLKKLDNP